MDPRPEPGGTVLSDEIIWMTLYWSTTSTRHFCLSAKLTATSLTNWREWAGSASVTWLMWCGFGFSSWCSCLLHLWSLLYSHYKFYSG